MESIKSPNNSKFTISETSGQAGGSGKQFHHVLLQSGQSKEAQQPAKFRMIRKNLVTSVFRDHMLRAPRVPHIQEPQFKNRKNFQQPQFVEDRFIRFAEDIFNGRKFFLPFQDINVIHIKMKCKPEGIIIKKKKKKCNV
jgi:hypothetical protein